MVGAKVCELTDGFLWFVCGLYVVCMWGLYVSPNEHVHTYVICKVTYQVEAGVL